jgi:deazaflavin-dependent oxidoreductase (nitroreductase family)
MNRSGLNRVTRHLAPWLPGFGVIVHRGRRSGKIYRTPVNLFPRRGGYAVALTYGPDSEWVKNVLAAGGCEIETGGKTRRTVNPRVVADARRRLVPPPVRAILRLLGVSRFLLLDRAR